MKATGIVLLVIAAIAFLVAFTMDTTVATDFGGRRVHNIGLMNDRQNIIIVAGVLAVIGAIFVVFARRSLQPSKRAIGNSLIRTCPYCAETVKAAATICRFCQRELPSIAASSEASHVRNDLPTPLMQAVIDGDDELVERLLTNGANPLEEDSNGATPLQVARDLQHYSLVDLLLSWESPKRKSV